MALHKNKRIVLLFSGYNQRSIIAFCRFATRNDIDFGIVAKDSFDTIYLSAYKSKVIAERSTNTFSVEEILKYRISLEKEFVFKYLVVLPSSEYLNRFLIKNREELESHNIVIPLVNRLLYEQISDKYSFGDLCKKNQIQIPKEIVVTQKQPLNFPIIAKPKKYFANNGNIYYPTIISDKHDYFDFIGKNTIDDFYFQEFISGKSFYLLCYFSLDKTYSIYSQQNLIQQFNGKSIIAAQTSSIHKGEIRDKFVNLFHSIHFFGLIMIELKYDNNVFFMIEANPRLWGPSQLILDADMDLFYRFSLDLQLIDNIPSLKYKKSQKYFWSGGIMEDQKKGKKPAFHDYSEVLFFNEFSSFAQNDIYAKEDTAKILLSEIEASASDN